MVRGRDVDLGLGTERADPGLRQERGEQTDGPRDGGRQPGAHPGHTAGARYLAGAHVSADHCGR